MFSEKILKVYPIISLRKLLIPGRGQFGPLRAWSTGVMQGTSRHCCILNIYDVGLIVSEDF